MTQLTPDALWAQMQDQLQDGALFDQALSYSKDYLKGGYDRRIAPSEEAERALKALDEPMPDGLGDPSAILSMLNDIGGPGTVGQIGGRFFGLVNGGIIPTGLAARMLADSWDQNAVLYAVSPTNAVIEEVCQRWLREIFGLPDQTVAGFVSGTSMALVCGLAAARWRLCERAGYDINKGGLAGAPRLRLVTSRHTHSTVLKAVALLGFGTDCIEWVEVDKQGRLRLDTLPELDDKTVLILQAGNVNSGSFDPLDGAIDQAEKAGAWVHIDGAFGLWAAAVQDLKHLTKGMERAQSWSVDGHKTLNTPYDNGISLCADPEAMVKALQNSAAYIMASDQRDGMNYTPEMSRRARAIDLWATLKYLGKAGLDQMILTLHQRAVQFAGELAHEGFDILNDTVFNQVLVRIGDQTQTDAVIDHIRTSGEAWVGASRWFDEPVVRISVCSWATRKQDVTRTVNAFVAARREVFGL